MMARAGFNDRKLNARMNEPHENADAVNAAMAAFEADVRAAREKHKVADAVVIMRVCYNGQDGEPVEAGGAIYIGDSRNWLLLLATEYGRERIREAEMFARLASGQA